ncbi:MAG: hypothetical protein H0X62_04775 [Bacteroidetes bacterium]|nr:hypothetical protein [Bacteroidota bacterium]
MQKILFLFSIIFLAFFSPGLAQEKTLGNKQIEQEEPGLRQGDVLLIPFDERMYNSEFDRGLAEKEGLEFAQIRSIFRKAIDTSLYMNVLVDHSVITLLRWHNPDVAKDINKVWASVSFNYEDIEVEKPGAKGILKAKQKPQKAATSGPVKVSSGQLSKGQEDKEKHMAVVANNTEAFQEMYEKYGSIYFIFINQVDIKRAKGTSYISMEQNDFQKEARLHYTILNLKGERVASGVSVGSFHSGYSKLQDYIDKGIKPAAAKIAEQLPKTEQ